MFIRSLYSLIFLLPITLINIILSRRKTFTISLIDQLFFMLLSLIIFGPLTLIYSILCLAGIIFIHYRQKYILEGSNLDYTKEILSFNRLINRFSKPKNLGIGRVVPTNKHELKYNNKLIDLDDTIMTGGMLITGATGSGKTTGIKSIIQQNIGKKPIGFIDFKGETEILDDIQKLCEEANVPYYEFSARECNFSYDPFKNLNETGKIEALMNTRRWDSSGADEHYKTGTQLVIQKLVREYDNYRKQHKETINYLLGLRNYSYSYKPEYNEKDGLMTLQKQLDILITSRAKELWVKRDRNFSFESDENYVICFSFISANKGLANSLMSFIFQDLLDRGVRHPYLNKFLLCVDEFGTLENSTLIKDILEKGRSAGIQTIFSILDINQISMTSGEYFVNALLGTINSFMIYAGATQKTAELLGGVQKFDKSFDIMSLRKPYKGKPPTALFISKFPLFNKNQTQEVFKVVPYIQKAYNLKKVETEEKETTNKIQEHVFEKEEVKETEDRIGDLMENEIDMNDMSNFL